MRYFVLSVATALCAASLTISAGYCDTRDLRDEREDAICVAVRVVQAETAPIQSLKKTLEVYNGVLELEKKAQASPGVVYCVSRLLRIPDPDVRYWAARALGEIGPAAAGAVPALETAIRRSVAEDWIVLFEPVLEPDQIPPPVDKPAIVIALKRIRDAAPT